MSDVTEHGPCYAALQSPESEAISYEEPKVPDANVHKKWQARVACLKSAHFQSSNHYDKRSTLLGTALIVVSALVGALAALTPSFQQYKFIWDWLTPIASLVATVLAGLQIFFRYSERAERHRQAGSNYARLEMILDLRAGEQTEDGQGVTSAEAVCPLKEVLSEWAWLTSGGPVIPRSIYKRTCECLDYLPCGKDNAPKNPSVGREAAGEKADD